MGDWIASLEDKLLSETSYFELGCYDFDIIMGDVDLSGQIQDQRVGSLQAQVHLLETQIRDKTIAHNTEASELQHQLSLYQSSAEDMARRVHELTTLTDRLKKENVHLADTLQAKDVLYRLSLTAKDQEIQELQERPGAPLTLPRSASIQVEFLAQKVVDLRKKYASATAKAVFFETQLVSLVEEIERNSGNLAAQQSSFSELSAAYLRVKDRLTDIVASEATQLHVIAELQEAVQREKEASLEAKLDCQELALQVQSLLGELSKQRTTDDDIASVRDIKDMQSQNLELKKRLRDLHYLARADVTLAAKSEVQEKDRVIEELRCKVEALERALADPQFADTARGEERTQTRSEVCYECSVKSSVISEAQSEASRLRLIESSLCFELHSLKATSAQLRSDLTIAETNFASAQATISALQQEIDSHFPQISALQSDNQQLRGQCESLLADNVRLNFQSTSLRNEYLRVVTAETEEKDRLYAQLLWTQQELTTVQRESSNALVKLTAEKENMQFELNSIRHFPVATDFQTEIATFRGEIARLKGTILALETANAHLSNSLSVKIGDSSRSEALRNQTIFVKLREKLLMALSDSESRMALHCDLSEKCRKLEGELTAAKEKIRDLEGEISAQVDANQRASDAFDQRLAQIRSEFASERAAWEQLKAANSCEIAALQNRVVKMQKDAAGVAEAMEQARKEGREKAVSSQALMKLTAVVMRCQRQLHPGPA